MCDAFKVAQKWQTAQTNEPRKWFNLKQESPTLHFWNPGQYSWQIGIGKWIMDWLDPHLAEQIKLKFGKVYFGFMALQLLASKF